MIDASRSLHSGQRANAVEQLVVKDGAARRIRFFRCGDGDDHRNHIVGVETGVHGLQRGKGANHEASTNQQDQGQREL